MNQSASWRNQRHRGRRPFVFLSLRLQWDACPRFNEGVDHCVHAQERKCLLNLFAFNRLGSTSIKWIVSRPGCSRRALCEPLFLAETYLPDFLPLLPLSILPSFPPLHALSPEVDAFAGHLTRSVRGSLISRPGLEDSFSWLAWFVLKHTHAGLKISACLEVLPGPLPLLRDRKFLEPEVSGKG